MENEQLTEKNFETEWSNWGT